MVPALFVGLVVLFQGYVTWRVWRDPVFLRSEKIAQTKLIWLLPLLGCVMVFSMLVDESKHQDRS